MVSFLVDSDSLAQIMPYTFQEDFKNLLHVLEDGWFPPALICADPALERGPSLLMNDYLVALQMHR